MLNQGTHVKDFLRKIYGFPLLSTQVLKEFGIGKHLLDGINEGNVDFYLFENLYHLLYFLLLFPKVRGCLETF